MEIPSIPAEVRQRSSVRTAVSIRETRLLNNPGTSIWKCLASAIPPKKTAYAIPMITANAIRLF